MSIIVFPLALIAIATLSASYAKFDREIEVISPNDPNGYSSFLISLYNMKNVTAKEEFTLGDLVHPMQHKKLAERYVLNKKYQNKGEYEYFGVVRLNFVFHISLDGYERMWIRAFPRVTED